MGGLVGLRDRLGVCYTGRSLASFVVNLRGCRVDERGVSQQYGPVVTCLLPGGVVFFSPFARRKGAAPNLGGPERRVEVGSHPTRLETRTKESNMCASRRDRNFFKLNSRGAMKVKRPR